MNPVLSPLEVFTIAGAALSVLGRLVMAPPKIEDTFNKDRKNQQAAARELADCWCDANPESIRALTRYVMATVRLEGFWEWRGLAWRMRAYLALRVLVIWVVGLSVLFVMVYWAFAAVMTDEARMISSLFVRGAAIASAVALVSLLLLLHKCNTLYSLRAAHKCNSATPKAR